MKIKKSRIFQFATLSGGFDSTKKKVRCELKFYDHKQKNKPTFVNRLDKNWL